MSVRNPPHFFVIELKKTNKYIYGVLLFNSKEYANKYLFFRYDFYSENAKLEFSKLTQFIRNDDLTKEKIYDTNVTMGVGDGDGAGDGDNNSEKMTHAATPSDLVDIEQVFESFFTKTKRSDDDLDNPENFPFIYRPVDGKKKMNEISLTPDILFLLTPPPPPPPATDDASDDKESSGTEANIENKDIFYGHMLLNSKKKRGDVENDKDIKVYFTYDSSRGNKDKDKDKDKVKDKDNDDTVSKLRYFTDDKYQFEKDIRQIQSMYTEVSEDANMNYDVEKHRQILSYTSDQAPISNDGKEKLQLVVNKDFKHFEDLFSGVFPNNYPFDFTYVFGLVMLASQRLQERSTVDNYAASVFKNTTYSVQMNMFGHLAPEFFASTLLFKNKYTRIEAAAAAILKTNHLNELRNKLHTQKIKIEKEIEIENDPEGASLM